MALRASPGPLPHQQEAITTMDIAEACKTIRQANEFFISQGSITFDAMPLPKAVVVLRAYLENTRADGKCIQELLVADASLLTHTGIRSVMPFVLSAESLEASKRRAKFDHH